MRRRRKSCGGSRNSWRVAPIHATQLQFMRVAQFMSEAAIHVSNILRPHPSDAPAILKCRRRLPAFKFESKLQYFPAGKAPRSFASDEKADADILSIVHPLNLISRTAFDRPRNSPSSLKRSFNTFRLGEGRVKDNASDGKADRKCVSSAIQRAEPFRSAKRISPYGRFPTFQVQRCYYNRAGLCYLLSVMRSPRGGRPMWQPLQSRRRLFAKIRFCAPAGREDDISQSEMERSSHTISNDAQSITIITICASFNSLLLILKSSVFSIHLA